jgi:hypothetical protein
MGAGVGADHNNFADSINHWLVQVCNQQQKQQAVNQKQRFSIFVFNLKFNIESFVLKLNTIVE